VNAKGISSSSSTIDLREQNQKFVMDNAYRYNLIYDINANDIHNLEIN
jgi:hypothetical protein